MHSTDTSITYWIPENISGSRALIIASTYSNLYRLLVILSPLFSGPLKSFFKWNIWELHKTPGKLASFPERVPLESQRKWESTLPPTLPLSAHPEAFALYPQGNGVGLQSPESFHLMSEGWCLSPNWLWQTPCRTHGIAGKVSQTVEVSIPLIINNILYLFFKTYE